MFDSNGKLPFLQEGVLKDSIEADFCEFFPLGQEVCQIIFPIELTRYFTIPYGTANGPGAENQCKNVQNAKYCQNYFMPFIRDGSEGLQTESNKFSWNYIDNLRYSVTTFQDIDDSSENMDPNLLIRLGDFLIQNNSYARKVYSSLSKVLKNQTTTEILRSYFPYINNAENIQEAILNTTASIMIYMWWQVNGLTNGPGKLDLQPPFAYQGMCYPQQCSVEEIETNNRIFAEYLFKYNLVMPTIVPTPRIPDSFLFPNGIPENEDELNKLLHVQSTAVGCSDDEKYSGNWNPENYAIVLLVSSIGFFIFVGTLVELLERVPYINNFHTNDDNSNQSFGFRILTSFSVISNLEFIFQPSNNRSKGQRLNCLEGMRAISMTWVILGHNFGFGAQLLTYRNKMYSNQVSAREVGGIALEAIKQGAFSVDSFLFIGATILSFLLLGNLDKSNGWFHGKGIIRMVLFYVNRYLRISVPFGLVIGIYIGLLPLILTHPMRVHSLAVAEADCCKRYWWRKLTYSAIFGGENNSDCCLGQTWYLSFDMIWFCLSPLIVYPLWRTKFGKWNKILGVSWGFFVLSASIFCNLWYAYNRDYYRDQLQPQNNLPHWSIAPWGYRSHCYLVGLMTGYILHATRDKEIYIDSKLNIIIWQFVTLVGLICIYGQWWIDILYKPYLIFHKLAWGLCLSWITFACVKGYGGIINDILSWGLWLPISKISFMTYLFHLSFNYYYFVAQSYNLDVSFWLFTQIFVAQLMISLLIGLVGCLTLELPFGRVQKLLIGKLTGAK